MPYVPDYRVTTPSEEDSYVPQSGFGEYLGAQMTSAFVETTIAGEALKLEAFKAERAAYPELEQELIDAETAETDLFGGLITLGDRGEAREAIEGLPRLTHDEWEKSKYYREGMQYEPDITEPRMRVYSEWYDAQAKRNDIVERRDAGFIEGTAGFLAGFVGSAPDPINLVSFAVAPEAPLVTKLATGVAENVAGEVFTQLSTMDIRAEAGIAPTEGERVLNVAFAALTGAAFSAGSHLFHKRAQARAKRTGEPVEVAAKSERSPKLKKDSEGRIIGVVVEKEKPNVNNLTDKVINTLDTRQKFELMRRMDAAMEDTFVGPRLPEMDPHDPNFTLDVYNMAPFERVIRTALTGDPVASKALLDTLDLNDIEVRSSLIPERTDPVEPSPRALEQEARAVDNMPELDAQGVGDNQNIDLTGIDTPADDPLLQGKTLFEAADRETSNFEQGLSKAVDLINDDGCK